jgi:NTE family protein
VSAERRESAIVMSGGGARAAYQVGFLRALARRVPDFTPPIITGVSAGAINAAYLAANAGQFDRKVEDLVTLWTSLTPERVFDAGGFSLAKNMLRAGLKLVSGGTKAIARPHGMVDTTPLAELLKKVLGAEDGVLPGIAANIAAGNLRAVALTTSSYSTGQSITWVEGHSSTAWERAHRRAVPCRLGVDHVLASSSLPLFFPAVQIGPHWYGDGGMRLTAPLSPAIHLGATKVLAISTRYARSRAEADTPVIADYPPVAQIAGVLFNAIFLDLFDADALAVERVNKLLEHIPESERGELRPIQLLVLRPSRDLGKLANEHEAELPGAFRFMTRGLGTRETRSNDLLSLVMFQPDYLARLIEIGERDAEARAGDIETFLRAR